MSCDRPVFRALIQVPRLWRLILASMLAPPLSVHRARLGCGWRTPRPRGFSIRCLRSYGQRQVSISTFMRARRLLMNSLPPSRRCWPRHSLTAGTFKLVLVRRDLREPLDRGTVHLIAVWEQVVARAEELGRPVVCFGG